MAGRNRHKNKVSTLYLAAESKKQKKYFSPTKTEIMLIPNGGSAKKNKPNPKLKNVGKVTALVFDTGLSAPDPDCADLIDAKSLDHLLGQLLLTVPLEVKDLDGNIRETSMIVESSGDLLKEGVTRKVDILREQDRQKRELHQWHLKLTNDERAKKSMDVLLAANEKGALVNVLEQAADMLLNFENQ